MTDDQETCIQNAIDELPVGQTAKLADLLGDQWQNVGDDNAKRQLGKEFFRSVQNGDFANLQFDHKDSANHAIYVKA